MRFPSHGAKPLSTLLGIAATMVPDKRLKFLSLGISPFYGNSKNQFEEGLLLSEIMSPKYQLCNIDPVPGSLAAAAIFRGKVKKS